VQINIIDNEKNVKTALFKQPQVQTTLDYKKDTKTLPKLSQPKTCPNNKVQK